MMKKMTPDQISELLNTLKDRFEKNMNRHPKLTWSDVQTKLEKNDDKLQALHLMESSGGEPDVVMFDQKSKEIIFCDCSAESPKGRRSICYDHQALEARKKYKPADSAINIATEMGIEILNDEQYRALQQIGEFDTKTSSWIETPAAIRKLGGALFGDRRFNHVFIYHNGAESYYGARGFRGILRV